MQNGLIKVVLVTATGWTFSLSDLETVLRIFSLVIPIVYSSTVFLREHRKWKNQQKEEEKDNDDSL